LVLAAIQPRLLCVSRQYLKYLLAFGFVLAMFNAIWTLSVALNGAAISTVLVYSSAGFTALLGWWLLRERLDWAKLLAVVVCLAGCALVSEAVMPGNWRTHWLGILTGVVSGLCYAAYSLMGRSASQRGLNPWTTLFYTFGFATAFLLIFNLLPNNILPGTAKHLADFLWLGDAVSGWVVLFLLAAGPTVAGYGLYNVSLSHLPSSVVNLIATLEPVFTIVIAYLLLDELMNGMQLVGSFMIISGVVLLRLNESWLINHTRIWSRSTG
jgi:drug/metabolite transporter (DMT)-like permease